MVIALACHRRDRSLKSPDEKKVSNFPILLVFPTACHATAGLKLHKNLEGTQNGINIDENDSLKFKMY